MLHLHSILLSQPRNNFADDWKDMAAAAAMAARIPSKLQDTMPIQQLACWVDMIRARRSVYAMVCLCDKGI
jgi:hypothetical protein